MHIRNIPGIKRRKDVYEHLFKQCIPTDIKTYIEPFAGSFILNKFFENRPEQLIYNDIKIYEGIDDLDIDITEHLDYKECIEKYDGVDSFFYMDPPYFNREDLYDGIRGDKDFHEELRSAVDNIKGKWIMTYEDCSYIRKLYRGFNIYDYTGNTSHIKDILITNES